MKISYKSFGTVIVFLFISLCATVIKAQQGNAGNGWRNTSRYTYLYALQDEQVRQLYSKDPKAFRESSLGQPIDSFLNEGPAKTYAKTGNYLQLYAQADRLQYKLIENRNVQIRLLQKHQQLQFFFTDAAGHEIQPNIVNLGKKVLGYDPVRKRYVARWTKKDTLLQVSYDGISNFFHIDKQQQISPYYNRGYDDSAKPSFFARCLKIIKGWFKPKDDRYIPVPENCPGYLVFNKPIYRPGDTVKFKAFILDKHSRKPIGDPRLLIRLKENNFWDDIKILGYADAYRKGGYLYQFVLDDSLDLTLDDTYTISLEAPSSERYDVDAYDGDLSDEAYMAKRKTYLHGTFPYEEYELKSIQFTLRSDQKRHNKGELLSLYMKATDENGLAVPDGRVDLLVRVQGASQYEGSHQYIPDTLFQHSLPLDAVGETKYQLPDSIFPNASIRYKVQATFFNSNNERHEQEESMEYDAHRERIVMEEKGDSVRISYRLLGKETPISGSLIRYNRQDRPTDSSIIELPMTVAADPYSASYRIRAGKTEETLQLTGYEAKLNADGYRTADSLFIKVNNPRRLAFHYSLFYGDQLLEQGQADSLRIGKPFRKAGNVFLLLNYTWADQELENQVPIVLQEKQLRIQPILPLTIFPGQHATLGARVTDATGKPVAGADISAYAFTSKFQGAAPPFIPYLGKSYPARKELVAYQAQTEMPGRSSWMAWERWGKELGLNRLRYFQFTHPDPVFKYSTEHPITQIAPFVADSGALVPVHIVYIDDKPVYFSQTTHLQRYSFQVDAGKHRIRMRTANHSYTLDSLDIPAGKRTVLSIDARAPDAPLFRNEKMAQSDSLDHFEASQLNKYLIQVEPNFQGKFATIEQDGHYTLLNPDQAQSRYQGGNILTGPFDSSLATYQLTGGDPVNFRVEPTYSYLFRPGLLKQTSIPGRYPFSTRFHRLSPASYTDTALTKKEIDTLWRRYLDLRAYTHNLFTTPYIKGQNGRLLLQRDSSFKEFVRSVFFYRMDKPDYLHVQPGNREDMGAMPAGNYRVLYLLRGDRYFILDSIQVRANGWNYYAIRHPRVLLADSMSRRIGNMLDGQAVQPNQEAYTANAIKETFNAVYLNPSDFTGTANGYIIDRESKIPLPGVAVIISGTQIGTTTDAFGYFRLSVPAAGNLRFSYIGYETQEVSIRTDSSLSVALTAAANQLDEVVVMGYGTQRKQSMTASVSVVSALAGSVPGLQIRGAGTIGAGAKPLIVLDGAIYDGSLEGIDPNLIAETSILKDDAATALYGSRAANGVIVITSKKQQALQAEAAAADTLPSFRHNFRDDAYWQPTLTTDAQGKVQFEVTFPDDITNWRSFFIGMTDRQQSGFTEERIKSFRPVGAALNLPTFAVRGDHFQAIGKLMNYTADTLQVSRKFYQNGRLLKEGGMQLIHSVIDTFLVDGAGTDSLSLRYTLSRDNGYTDGEERKIPLVNAGVMETQGLFEALEKDSSLTLRFNPRLQEVTLHAEASVLPALLDETEHLRTYAYLCNEQLASKLKALLTQKKIKIWLKQDFQWDKDIREILKRLAGNKGTNGTWGWWKDSGEELWISLHVVEALLDAQAAGYEVTLDKQRLSEYFVAELNQYKGTDQLYAVEMLHRLGAAADVKPALQAYEKAWRQRRTKTKAYGVDFEYLRLLRAKQLAGMPITLDSLLEQQKHTMFGNVYWGQQTYRFFDNSIQLSILAYRIIEASGGQPALLPKICNYLLEQRQEGHWRNTFESALILETILPGLLGKQDELRPPVLQLSGAHQETVRQFPYTLKLKSSDQLHIAKTGNLPVYLTAYQQFWNDQPDKESKDFTVDTRFTDRQGKILDNLKGGQVVTLTAEVTARADGEYVMVEIPIPAGCSYESKPQNYWGYEVHREYFKDKVSIFCRKLRQGKHTFTVQLIPRYGGQYHLNPAKAELMYFPVFYGREQMKQVKID